ncbi:MAG: adenylate/guanylate cyclase domain-containing protein, partial [Kiloniellales bacterium]|nr:adenylate/guanylate cyclase domain-containing protein [Kiloniellales bacterium]
MERRLAAILAADIVGYSRLMGADEGGTLARLQALKADVVDPLIAQFNGRVVKVMGDGFLIEFASVVDALNCALDWQSAVEERAAEVPAEKALRFRIGVNLGDIIVESKDIYGDGVNVAARLEALAEPGSVLVSRTVFDHARGKVAAAFVDLGEQDLKNIAEPVQLFRVSKEFEAAKPRAAATIPSKSWRSFVAVTLVPLTLVAGLLVWQRPWAPGEEPASVEAMAFPLPDKPSIAVLPFNNMSDDASQDYFADGMTEDLITDLSKISGLFVIARNSSFSYKGRPVKIRQVAEELGIRYVLEGSVRRSGGKVRINAQLIDATTGGHLWAERYDGTLDDIFNLQDQVTAQIVSALKVSLTGEEVAEQARHQTENAAAHDAFLQGWALYKLGTQEDFKRALIFLNDAIERDPDYAQAHAALAALYLDILERGWAFDFGMVDYDVETATNEHLEAALERPTPLAHIVNARLMSSYGLTDLALAEAQQALALDRNDAVALAGLADALNKTDKPAEARENIERALRLDPHHPPAYLITHGGALFGLERFDEALLVFERAVQRSPGNEIPRIYRASILALLGQIDRADDAIEDVNAIRNRNGLAELSLRPTSEYAAFDFETEIDFPAYGGKEIRALLRKGLEKIPLLNWQYLVDVNRVLGPKGTTFEVTGARLLDLPEAKTFYDLGAIFIDTSSFEFWREGHVKGALHLPYDRSTDTSAPRLDRHSLGKVADKDDEIVFYYRDGSVEFAAWECAKALAWGYRKIY